MISLKDYAAQRNITYEAVRKSVTRYKDELEGHITIVDRTQYLDDEAVAFLDEKRKKNPVVIIQQNKDEVIEQQAAQIAELKDKLLAAQEVIINQKDEIIQLKDQNHALLTAGTPQAAPEPECQDEVVIDAETQQAKLTESLVGVMPEQKPDFWQRCRNAWNALKGE